ncbi:hypothetical protein [uncultured Thiodictyon sp.]|uniref:hypothetical protein n=1 Tax=uncultured Thiodictyon sp. TaxID=1846217 RepID=UPI0025E1C062|nr:hypothetical protein [uncultured Thiodictyon sp.]
MTESADAEKDKLLAKLAGLEALREDLEPATYESKRQALEARLATLVQTGGGAVVNGSVHTAGGLDHKSGQDLA